MSVITHYAATVFGAVLGFMVAALLYAGGGRMSEFTYRYCDVCGEKLPKRPKRFALGFSRRRHGPFLGLFFGGWSAAQDEYELCDECYGKFYELFNAKSAEFRREIMLKLGLEDE